MKKLIIAAAVGLGMLFGAAEPVLAQQNKAMPTIRRAVPGAKTKFEISPLAKSGDKYFLREEYYRAAEDYLKAYNQNNKDYYAAYMLAESYKSIFDYPRAEKFYKIVSEKAGQEYPYSSYWYALMMKTNGNYADAGLTFQKFVQEFKPLSADDQKFVAQANVEAAGCTLAVNEATKELPDYKFAILPSPVNTMYSDYAPAVYTNDSMIVVTSARPEVKGAAKDPRFGSRFSDNFMFIKQGNNWVESKYKDGFDGLNTRVNDGAGVFNAKRTKFYFTTCTMEDVCKIYVTELVAGKWSAPVELNNSINIPNYASKQPALSPSGDTLFFVSNRPGGFGGNDIWYSTKKGAGENWARAVNMGPGVNTAYQELSPYFYGPEKTFFFASNGREGFGGLDIFMTTQGFDGAKNIGLPFNSNRDDFYFVLGKRAGYLTSNRDNGVGNDDIYYFDLFNVSNSVVDAILNKEELAKKKPAEKEDGPLASNPNEESVDVTATVIDKDTNKPAANTEVELKDKKSGKVLKTSTTDDKGNTAFKNLPKKDYAVAVKKPAPPKAAAKKPVKPKIDEDDKLAVTELKVNKTRVKVTRFLFENIYFDFDSDSLRPEAISMLDDLISYSKNNPKIQIEMNANTDNIGDPLYNMDLSRRRGEAAKEYLLKNGMKPTSLVVRSNGENKPLTNNDNPTGRTLNRRVEFFVLGGYEYSGGAMAFVPETETSFQDIANRFGMTTDEIKKFNNTNEEMAAAYQAVRVKRVGEGGKVVAPVTLAISKKSAPDLKPELQNRPARPKKEPKKSGSKKTSYNSKSASGTQFTGRTGLKRGTEIVHVVQKNNTLYGLGRFYKSDYKALMALNNLQGTTIYVGQKLKVVVGNKSANSSAGSIATL